MSIDTTPLSTMALGLIEKIERAYEEYPDAEIGTVALVVEVNIPDSDDDEPGWTSVDYRCSDSRRWIQSGLFEAAKRCVWHNSKKED